MELKSVEEFVWSNSTPIIMITARDSVLDKISGLDSGAGLYYKTLSDLRIISQNESHF